MVSERGLQDLANLLRKDVLEMTAAAGSGHPTSCLSCAEIMSALFFREMKFDVNNPENLGNDEFILSKGHAAPILYACLKRAGLIREDLEKLRKLSSGLEGHPVPSRKMPWIKVATGSLGQGLSVGAGMALAQKKHKMFDSRVFVLLGDSECAEGSVWEAAQFAAFHQFNNLIAIVDVNRLGQRGQTMLGWRTEEYAKRFSAFGWETHNIDGHNIFEVVHAIEKARQSSKPFLILAKTVKGKGISFLENADGWHGKALNSEELKKALHEIPAAKLEQIDIRMPQRAHVLPNISKEKIGKKNYGIGEMISTREAYGDALVFVAQSNSDVVALDAEVSNSTFAGKVKHVRPEQFIECYIAEQNMIGVAVGLSKKGFVPFCSTFGAFLTRAHDQIRMAALSSTDITLCGSHAGVSIGEDGASQMALEDIGMMRSLPNSIVLYPSDAVSCFSLTKECLKLEGIKYVRTTRGKTPIIYSSNEKFPIGEFKALYGSAKDKVTLVGAGITLHECLKAAAILKKKKISVAVVDLYCVKPFDSKKFILFVKKHGSKIVVAEDHYAEGGIGEMLSSELNGSGILIERLAVREKPHSGKPEELLAKYGIDAKAIVRAAEKIVAKKI